jgi:hypothetical protein
MDKLSTVGARFNGLKEVGERGSELVAMSEKVILNIRKVIGLYEEGLANPNWSNNLQQIGGEEAVECSIIIYSALKEALAKIDKVI